MIRRCLGTADVLGYLSADRQAACSKVFVPFRVGHGSPIDAVRRGPVPGATAHRILVCSVSKGDLRGNQ